MAKVLKRRTALLAPLLETQSILLASVSSESGIPSHLTTDLALRQILRSLCVILF